MGHPSLWPVAGERNNRRSFGRRDDLKMTNGNAGLHSTPIAPAISAQRRLSTRPAGARLRSDDRLRGVRSHPKLRCSRGVLDGAPNLWPVAGERNNRRSFGRRDDLKMTNGNAGPSARPAGAGFRSDDWLRGVVSHPKLRCSRGVLDGAPKFSWWVEIAKNTCRSFVVRGSG